MLYLSFPEYYQQLCQKASRRWDLSSDLIEWRNYLNPFSLSDQVISGLETVPELAQEARASYLEKLLEENINAAVAFGTYILGLTSIVNFTGVSRFCVLPFFIFTPWLRSDSWAASGAGSILSLQHCRLSHIRHRILLRTVCWAEERLGRLH